ncbi:hypothetical protein HPP92_016523 [Vanilla planifolia]|uniref:DELLA protein n=1 Tax=Vanilla planifolia TaxID=51239 RepID=A0A835UQ65_VANPL|nr:hypothetical protein HPP92_016523 [Vanilla planifolia]
MAASSCGSEVSSLVMLDTQEVGIRLVHALMACAEAVQHDNFTAADVLVKQISILAESQGGAMRKVAGFFAEALARRIYRLHPLQDNSLDSAFSDILYMHFYESCPYLKFAHFTANQAILEAFTGCRSVHVIDFSMKQGMQWPALMQALALRPGGPPSFRLTGIGPPQPDNTDALQQVGWKLAQLADTIHVDFEYRGFVANSLADLEPFMLESPMLADHESDEQEVVAINSVFELHRLLAWPGALEKVLATVRAVKPRILTVVEHEANHNSALFLERFTEALHYYSTMFDSLEGGGGASEGQQDQVMSEMYLGRQICNVVACEGAERAERHETLLQWRGRMERAGFAPQHLGSNAFKQASMLLALFASGDGYRVEKEGCPTLWVAYTPSHSHLGLVRCRRQRCPFRCRWPLSAELSHYLPFDLYCFISAVKGRVRFVPVVLRWVVVPFTGSTSWTRWFFVHLLLFPGPVRGEFFVAGFLESCSFRHLAPSRELNNLTFLGVSSLYASVCM